MPKLNDPTMEQNTLTTNSYGYSAVRPDNLGAFDYTLVDIEIDISSSVSAFVMELETALQTVIGACQKSPRSDSLMVRINTFSNDLSELHGFKELSTCQPSDYNGVIHPYGMTALCDAAENGISSVLDYANVLKKQRIRANGIVFVITDGCDNASKLTSKYVKEAKNKAIKGEELESLLTILVGVNANGGGISSILATFKDDGGFDQYEVATADTSTFARLADFISKSISSQSQSLGSGGPSQTLTF